MIEDPGAVHEVVTGMTTVATILFGFIGRRFIGKVDDTADALARHEKEDIGKYATVDQLQRVHDRIDDGVKSSAENFKELRDNVGEIKTLLINGGHR